MLQRCAGAKRDLSKAMAAYLIMAGEGSRTLRCVRDNNGDRTYRVGGGELGEMKGKLIVAVAAVGCCGC